MLSWGPCAPSVSWGKNLSLTSRLSLSDTCQLCFSSLFKFDKRFIFFISKNLFFSYSDIFPLEVKPSSKAINHRSRWSGAGYTCLVGPSQRALTVAPPLTLPGLPAYGRCALCYVTGVTFQTETFLSSALPFLSSSPSMSAAPIIVAICPSTLGPILQCVICKVSSCLVCPPFQMALTSAYVLQF